MREDGRWFLYMWKEGICCTCTCSSKSTWCLKKEERALISCSLQVGA